MIQLHYLYLVLHMWDNQAKWVTYQQNSNLILWYNVVVLYKSYILIQPTCQLDIWLLRYDQLFDFLNDEKKIRVCHFFKPILSCTEKPFSYSVTQFPKYDPKLWSANSQISMLVKPSKLAYFTELSTPDYLISLTQLKWNWVTVLPKLDSVMACNNEDSFAINVYHNEKKNAWKASTCIPPIWVYFCLRSFSLVLPARTWIAQIRAPWQTTPLHGTVYEIWLGSPFYICGYNRQLNTSKIVTQLVFIRL